MRGTPHTLADLWAGNQRYPDVEATVSYREATRIYVEGPERDTLRLDGHKLPIRAVAWAPDGVHLVSGGDETVRVWNGVTGCCVVTMTHPRGVFDVAWSPNGRWIASAGFDDQLRIWDTATWEEVVQYHLLPIAEGILWCDRWHTPSSLDLLIVGAAGRDVQLISARA